MASPVLYATNELVAQAWISSIPGFDADVGEQLPADTSTWQQTGFVTVAVAGGAPDVDIAVKRPVVQVDCWATSPGSNKPPWWQANHLAETIRAACYDHAAFGRELHPQAGTVTYPTARALTAYVLTEPHRIYGDVADNAGYSFDLQLHWCQLD